MRNLLGRKVKKYVWQFCSGEVSNSAKGWIKAVSQNYVTSLLEAIFLFKHLFRETGIGVTRAGL